MSQSMNYHHTDRNGVAYALVAFPTVSDREAFRMAHQQPSSSRVQVVPDEAMQMALHALSIQHVAREAYEHYVASPNGRRDPEVYDPEYRENVIHHAVADTLMHSNIRQSYDDFLRDISQLFTLLENTLIQRD